LPYSIQRNGGCGTEHVTARRDVRPALPSRKTKPELVEALDRTASDIVVYDDTGVAGISKTTPRR